MKRESVLNDTDTLRRFSQYELQIIRNSFFAREGYKFQNNRDIIDYFNRMQGYNEYSNDPSEYTYNFSEDEINFIHLVERFEGKR